MSNNDEQLFGADGRTGIFVSYDDDDCRVHLMLDGEQVPPARTATRQVIHAVFERTP